MADYFLLGSSDVNVGFDYADALSSPSGASISLGDEAAFEMTFFVDVDDATTTTTPPLDAIFASAIGRCSLLRVAFRVVAEGRTNGNLARNGVEERVV